MSDTWSISGQILSAVTLSSGYRDGQGLPQPAELMGAQVVAAFTVVGSFASVFPSLHISRLGSLCCRCEQTHLG